TRGDRHRPRARPTATPRTGVLLRGFRLAQRAHAHPTLPRPAQSRGAGDQSPSRDGRAQRRNESDLRRLPEPVPQGSGPTAMTKAVMRSNHETDVTTMPATTSKNSATAGPDSQTEPMATSAIILLFVGLMIAM